LNNNVQRSIIELGKTNKIIEIEKEDVMKKTTALAKMDDIDKPVYYENALYEHDHKENRKTDLQQNTEFSISRNPRQGALKLLQKAIL